MQNSKPAPRKPRADAVRNRARILEAAKEVFAQDESMAAGQFSMDEVARAAGVGPGTLYRHFPTREALLAEVYGAELEKLAAAEREFSAKLPPVEALRAWMLLFVDYIATKQIILPAINAIPGGPARIFERSGALITGAIDALVNRAVASGEIRVDVAPMDLLRALYGVSVVAAVPEWPQSARRMVDILILGSRVG